MVFIEIRERLRATDPTTKAPHRLINLLFSILQWIAFAATIQAIGIRVQEPLLRGIGYVLYLIVLIHTARITWIAVSAIFVAAKFRSFAANFAVRLLSLALSLCSTAILVSAFRSAASKMLLFYSKN
jgi:hypothetical protein